MKFKSLSEWKKKDPKSYLAAAKLKIHREIAQKIGIEVQNTWTHQDLLDSASQFSSMVGWRSAKGAYRTAYAMGVQRQIAKELGWSMRVFWDFELLIEDAKKYNNHRDWSVNSAGYNSAATQRLQHKIAEAVGWIETSYGTQNYDSAYKKASVYKSTTAWKKGDVQSYTWAVRNKMLISIAKKLNWSVRERKTKTQPLIRRQGDIDYEG